MTTGKSYDARVGEELAAAAEAFRRRDDATFRGHLRSILARAPERVDLWVDLANHHIQCGDVAGAVETFRRACAALPGDVDAVTHLAHWLRYQGDVGGAEAIRERLAEVRPGRAEELERIWAEIDGWQMQTVSDELPEMANGCQAVVTLGYALHADGGMDAKLVERLEKTLEAAERFPGCAVVVSGGMPRAGRVEAVAMREWLAARGVARERIFEEGHARDVVENILYSRQILGVLRVESTLWLTSAGNVRRTGAALGIVSWAAGAAWGSFTVRAASGKSFSSWSDDGSDALKLYRDALRAYGLPMMRTYPMLVER